MAGATGAECLLQAKKKLRIMRGFFRMAKLTAINAG
jgi:hypothetical protein